MGRKYRFDPTDKDALGFWDTSEWETSSATCSSRSTSSSPLSNLHPDRRRHRRGEHHVHRGRERTREIGVRRAVGATRADIMRQFFAEALIIVAMARAGLLLSVGLVTALGGLPIKSLSAFDHFRAGAGRHVELARHRRVRGRLAARPARGGARSGGGAAHLMFSILLREFIADLRRSAPGVPHVLCGDVGTLAVVLLLAFGEGLKRTVRDGLLGAGSGSSWCTAARPQGVCGPGAGRRTAWWRRISISSGARSRTSTAAACPTAVGDVVPDGKTRTNAFLEGVGSSTRRSATWSRRRRALHHPTDVAQKRRVLFLGTELAERIFGKGVDPVAKSVVVDGLPFTVVGV